MKKRFLGCTAAVLTAMTLLSGGVSMSADAEETMKIVALGDSITTGYSLDNSLKGSYADMVSCYYNAELTNLAQDGFTSADLLAQLSDPSVQAAVAEADIVLVTVGGNDVLQPVLKNEIVDSSQYETMGALINSLSGDVDLRTQMNVYLSKTMPPAIKTFRENVVQIADKLKASTGGTIVFQTVYNPMDVDADDTPLASSGSMELLRSYVTKFLEGVPDNTIYVEGQCVNGAIRDLSGVTVVDSYETLFDHGYYYTRINDVDVHPNNAGHLAIAESIIRKLNLPETGRENGTAMRAAYTSDNVENTLANVNSDYNSTIYNRVLMNSRGDVDADGSVAIADATSVLGIYAANAAGADAPVTGVNALAADGNIDGAVNLEDASAVLQYYSQRAAGMFSGTFTDFVNQ